MKLSKTFLFITALCCATPTLAIQNSTSSGEQKWQWKIHKTFEIYLAGGCFWGMEAYMERIHGVKDAISGYANGNTGKTSYHMIGLTDHAETVKVTYDANQISLDKLLKYYFKVIDPTSVNKQGNDRGRQYRTGIYYQDGADKAVIEQALAQLQTKYKNQCKLRYNRLKITS